LFCAPQTSQVRNVLRLVFVSKRLPQSVQKTRDPMAAIFAVCMLSDHVQKFFLACDFACEGESLLWLASPGKNSSFTLRAQNL